MQIHKTLFIAATMIMCLSTLHGMDNQSNKLSLRDAMDQWPKEKVMAEYKMTEDDYENNLQLSKLTPEEVNNELKFLAELSRGLAIIETLLKTKIEINEKSISDENKNDEIAGAAIKAYTDLLTPQLDELKNITGATTEDQKDKKPTECSIQ